MNKNLKILVLGHGRHAKDTVAQMINNFTGLTFKSSSLAASEIFLYDELKHEYDYQSPEECFNDRHTDMGTYNMRDVWHRKISEYNTPDKSKLAEEILKYNNMYVGMRSNSEVQSCIEKGLFDIIIGVFDPRKPLEPSTSFDIDMWSICDFIIMNNSTLYKLEERVKLFCKTLE